MKKKDLLTAMIESDIELDQPLIFGDPGETVADFYGEVAADCLTYPNDNAPETIIHLCKKIGVKLHEATGKEAETK